MGMGLTADVFRQMKTKNVAAVMVTAQLPAFARPGTTIDILVSSVGDAEIFCSLPKTRFFYC